MKRGLHYLTMFVVMSIGFSLLFSPEKAEESFTYFPIDPSASFQTADTSLSLKPTKNKQYVVEWSADSVLDRKAYLRQDITLLYVNGVLAGKSGKTWKQYASAIKTTGKAALQDSAYFQVISFHHAELHENEQITSVQAMTHDELYVIDSSFSPLSSFRRAVTAEEKEWKALLDKLTDEKIKAVIAQAVRTYSLPVDNYTMFFLTEFSSYTDKPLPGFSDKESSAIIGRLWEGLYKNYFLGIRKEDGTYAEPYGSTIPVILMAKDQSHLLVISKLKDGEVMLLRQVIPSLSVVSKNVDNHD